jgi:hypothetical protein
VRKRERWLVPSRTPALSDAARSERPAIRPGAIVVTSAAPTAHAVAMPSVRQSENRAKSVPSGRSSVRIAAPPNCARTSPAAQPIPASTSPSVMNWPRRRERLTPSARRTVTSRRRLMTRASIRFVTLAQAMSSTITATPAIHTSTRDSSPGSGPAACFTGPAIARGCDSESAMTRGFSARARARLRMYAALSSADAAASVTPGRRTATTCTQSQL